MKKRLVVMIAGLAIACATFVHAVDLRPFSGSMINYYGNGVGLSNVPIATTWCAIEAGGYGSTNINPTYQSLIAPGSPITSSNVWGNSAALVVSTNYGIYVKMPGMYLCEGDASIYSDTANQSFTMYVVQEGPIGTNGYAGNSVRTYSGSTTLKISVSAPVWCGYNALVYPAVTCDKKNPPDTQYVDKVKFRMSRIDPTYWGTNVTSFSGIAPPSSTGPAIPAYTGGGSETNEFKP